MRSLRVMLILCLVLSSLLTDGCKPRYRQQDKPLNSSMPDNESIYRANQLMIKQNTQLILDNAKKKGWVLSETGTGVFYHIYPPSKKHEKRKIQPGDRVALTYNLKLLDGTDCYSSKNQGLKQFVVEKSEAETGLHEAIQILSPGDSALIVIPPHRAYGLTGDGDKIPPRAILVYEIRVDSVIRHLTN